MTGKTRNVLRTLVAKPFGKRPLERPDKRTTLIGCSIAIVLVFSICCGYFYLLFLYR
jgi:hypothetical protein